MPLPQLDRRQRTGDFLGFDRLGNTIGLGNRERERGGGGGDGEGVGRMERD